MALMQQIINISSIVGRVGSLIFCIWAYQAGFDLKASLLLSSRRITGHTLFIFFTILQAIVLSFQGRRAHSVAGSLSAVIIRTIYSYRCMVETALSIVASGAAAYFRDGTTQKSVWFKVLCLFELLLRTIFQVAEPFPGCWC